MSKSKGRPKGSSNIATVVDVEPRRCPECKCSDRVILNTRSVVGFVIRRCQCNHCGKVWLERERK